MRNRHWRWALAAILTSLVAQPHAQQTMSSELRMLLVRSGPPGAEAGEPRPGPPPADFPQEVLPRGTTPVGSVTSGNRTIVVGTMSSRPAGWRADFLSTVSDAGWLSQMPAQVGFVMSSQVDGTSICKGTTFVDVSLMQASGGATNVRATVTRDPRRQCASRGAGSTMSFADVMFPVLEPPPGAKSASGGGGGSSADWTSHLQLTTELPLAAIADHYRRQIIDAGWAEDGAPAIFDNAIIVRFKVPSKLGPALPAMLVVSAFEHARQYDLFLRLTRPPDRAP